MAEIFFIPIDGTIREETFRRLLTCVTKEKQRYVNSFCFDIDKKLSLYSELFVRAMACQRLGISNDQIEFCKGKYGKPFLGGFPGFYFNISHTRSAIAAAFSHQETGIDIEKTGNDDCEIAKRFFAAEEYEYIYQEKNGQGRRFFEIWTKKEAYIKCIGKGMFQPLDSFNVLRMDSEFVCHSLEKDGYMISVCGERREKLEGIREISEGALEACILEERWCGLRGDWQ